MLLSGRDPTDKCRYTWTEIYKDDQALLDHFDNPAVKDAMGPQSDRSVRRSTDTQPFHCQPGVATSTFRKPLGRDAWHETEILCFMWCLDTTTEALTL